MLALISYPLYITDNKINARSFIMDPRDISFLLLLISYIFWAAGLLSIFFMQKKDWVYLPITLILLHSQWLMLIVFFIIALLFCIVFSPISYPYQNIVEFALLFGYLSLPCLYFITLLFRPPRKENIFIFFCITSLTSILTFAGGVTLFLCFASRQ